ncbi:uncharacterized protein LOC141851116 [Brevipalpus obovatus]|uniref:uncharacterized protein LOC141851116 n=1 Tax=Brevipalpus obovatus TaxID=246614 RepID=UPI003D9E5A34
MCYRALPGALDWLTTTSIIRMVPGGMIGLTGVVLAGLLGIQYFRQRKLNRAPSPQFRGCFFKLVNRIRFRFDPDSFLKKTEQLTEEHGGILELRGIWKGLRVFYQPFAACKKRSAAGPSRGIGACALLRDLLLISDLDAAKDVLQSEDGKYREKNMLNWMDSVGLESKDGKPFDTWLGEQKELRKKYRTFSFERSSPDQMEKLYETVLPTLKVLMSLSNDESPSLSRSDLMLLTTNTLMEYLCGKRFHSRNERFSRFLDEVDQLHENFVLKHVYLRVVGDCLPGCPLLRNSHQKRAEKASTSAKYIMEFLESDVGLIEMRETMRENYSDGSYPDDSGLNLAQVLIKNHLENSDKISWGECVKAIASLVSSASPISNMTMASLGYLSQDKGAQNLIHDEIFRTFGKHRTDYLSVEKSMKLVQIKAVLMETYRMFSSPPILLTTEEDSIINGYNIDKGTDILVNIEQLNHSPKLWEEPEKFKHSRFLTASDKDPETMIIKKPSAYLPYNFGRKSHAMMGLLEHIASNVLANIISQFKVESNREDMKKSGLGSYKSIDMKNFLTINLKKRA